MYCRFCPLCGTHLLVTSQRRPHFTAVRVGTLDVRMKYHPNPQSGRRWHQRGRRLTPSSPASTDSLRQEDQLCLADVHEARSGNRTVIGLRRESGLRPTPPRDA
jgi:hypothetical protein